MATKKSAKKSSSKKSSSKKSSSKKSSTKQSSSKKTSAEKSAKKTSQAAGRPGAASFSEGRCRNWKAVSNRMPPGPASLTVTGQCTFPTPGYRVRLVKAVPQGINPAILLLRKIVTPPSGPRPDVLDTVDVRYRQRGGTQYTHVTILPDGTTVKVQIVV